MWSQRTRYAVRVLIDLAAHPDRRVAARQLAEQNDIPAKYLEAILGELRTAGIVTSTKGPTGGYRLAHDPTRIRLLDVFRAMDPQFFAETSREGGAARGLEGSSRSADSTAVARGSAIGASANGVSAGANDDREHAILNRIVVAWEQVVRPLTVADALAQWQQSRATLTYVI